MLRLPVLRLLAIAVFGFLWTLSVQAGPRQQANKMFERLNGIPPSKAKLDQMVDLIGKGDYRAAALAAIEDDAGNFYNVILKNWWTPKTNENEDGRAALNDYTALVIGMTRDEIPFNGILSDDLIYLAVDPSGRALPSYTQTKANDDDEENEHFLEVEARNLPLHKVLKAFKQSEVTDYAPDVAAGAFSTWGFAKDYYNMGTNRVATRFTLKTFLCRDIEQIHDPTRSDRRVRRDVTREPGGDSNVYRNKCAGCHTGMDPATGAFSYWDYTADEGVVYDPTNIRDKINRGADTFAAGYVTNDDSWEILWNEGPNKKIGWNGELKGFGAKGIGKAYTSTDAFARCMASEALNLICQVDLESANVRQVIEQMAHNFKKESDGVKYNLKHLFANAAVMCKGE